MLADHEREIDLTQPSNQRILAGRLAEPEFSGHVVYDICEGDSREARASEPTVALTCWWVVAAVGVRVKIGDACMQWCQGEFEMRGPSEQRVEILTATIAAAPALFRPKVLAWPVHPPGPERRVL